jgi:hypothetical protein
MDEPLALREVDRQASRWRLLAEMHVLRAFDHVAIPAIKWRCGIAVETRF